MRSIATAPVILFALLLSGCANTSPQFQTGAYASGPRLASRAAGYVTADASLDATTKAARIAQAQKLSVDTASMKSIVRSVVADDWTAVKAWLPAYIAANPDPDQRAVQQAMADEFTKLIADEAARPFAGK